MVYGLAGLMLLGTYAASRALDRPVSDFAEDPTEILDEPAYLGFLSNLGALVWTVSVTACLVAWLGTGRSLRSPFLWGGIVTLLLLTDDFFRLHESYYPEAGIPQSVAQGAYGVAALAFVAVFRDFLRRQDLALFLAGGALLALSTATDVLLGLDAPFLAEDGAKFVGLVTWAVFFVRACLRALSPAR